MVFHWSLSNSKSPQVSRTLLSSLAVLNYVVVCIVSTRPPTPKSSSPFSNPLMTVPKTPITIDIIVTFMFHSFFNSLARSSYLSFFSLSFNFILWSSRPTKSTILQVLFFLCGLLKGLVFWPRLGDPFVCQSPVRVYVRHSLGQKHLPFVRMVKFKFLAHLQADHLAQPVHLVLYSFCANLLHSLIM